MPHEFEIRLDAELDATPERIWEAIATGPGIDSWFMGHTELEPREGGRGRFEMGGHVEESTVTAWEPGKRLAYRGDPGPEGTFMAFEYLIEGRQGGSTVVRFVHSGILGDEWETEYDAISKGDAMYLDKLVQYVTHFPGRTARHGTLIPGPQVADAARVWDAFRAALGLTGPVTVGTPARLSVDGLDPLDGVVDHAVEPVSLGLRTADWMYRFLHGYQNTVVVEYHAFTDDVDPAAVEAAWHAWLDRTFA
jgi:uncharacterized protein YndB with AHSA1/START domain